MNVASAPLFEIVRQIDPFKMASFWDNQARMWVNGTGTRPIEGAVTKARTKRRTYVKRGPSGPSRQLARVPRGGLLEVKWFDIDPTTVNLNTTGSVTFLNNVPIGTEGTQRTGDRLLMKSIELFFNLGNTGNAGAVAGENSRVLLVYDKQPVPGSSPSISTILENGTGTTNPKVFKNLDNRDRYIILRDQRMSFPDTQLATASLTKFQNMGIGGSPWFKWYVKLNVPTVFERGAANIHTGALYLVTLGDVVLGTEAWNGSFTSRLRYTDA